MTAARFTPRLIAFALVGVAMALSALALLYWGRDQAIQGEALGYAARLASQPFDHAVLHSPPNKYFIALPLLLYHALFHTFGLAADLPYRLVATALVLLCAGLFFVLARRRVGDLLAVPPTVLLLFFGSGWETVITPLRLPSLIAVAAGLGALIALEKRNRRGDIVAATLLAASVASHPVGLSFLAAAGVLVAFRPWPQPWRSAWLLAVPAAVFGAWWLFLRAPTTAVVFPTRPIDIVHFAVDSWTALTAAVSGLAGVLDEPAFDQTIAQITATALFASLVVLLVMRRGRVPASFWAALAALVVVLVATRLSPGGWLRSPEEIRYLYPEGVLFLLLLTEAAGAARVRGWAALALTGVLALGLAYNVDRLRDGGATARLDSQRALAQYTVYEIAGSSLREDFKPGPFSPTAGEYADAAARYGSVTQPVAELAVAPLLIRQAADAALAGSLGLALRPARGRGAAGPPPRVVQELGARVARRHGCLRLQASRPANGTAPATVPLDPSPSNKVALRWALRGETPPTVPELAELAPPGEGLVLATPDISKTAILVGRFAPPAAPLDRPERARFGTLRLPAAGLAQPWRVIVASSEPVTVCGLSAR
ncbi:MAG: hypothetical protein AABM66_05305 [Actinomycetota bacterium]